MKVWEGGDNLVGVNVCLPCAPSILLLSVAILAPCVSCSLSAESLLFGMVWFVYGHLNCAKPDSLSAEGLSEQRIYRCSF